MKYALIFGALLILGLAAYLAYLGAFRTVVVEEREAGPFAVVYLPQTGNYRQTGDSVGKIGAALKAIGIDNNRYYAIYYDNPEVVPEEKLRSEAGHVLTEITPELRTRLGDQFQYKQIDKRRYLVAEFPLRNFLSIFLGISKVYPRLFAAGTARGLQVPGTASLEIYEPSAGRITYMLPLD